MLFVLPQRILHVPNGSHAYKDRRSSSTLILTNYLRAVDHLAAMQIEEYEESILARLLHSIDKSRFETECIVVDLWGRRKRTLNNIVSYLKNAEQKQRSEKAKGRVRWRLP